MYTVAISQNPLSPTVDSLVLLSGLQHNPFPQTKSLSISCRLPSGSYRQTLPFGSPYVAGSFFAPYAMAFLSISANQNLPFASTPPSLNRNRSRSSVGMISFTTSNLPVSSSKYLLRSASTREVHGTHVRYTLIIRTDIRSRHIPPESHHTHTVRQFQHSRSPICRSSLRINLQDMKLTRLLPNHTHNPSTPTPAHRQETTYKTSNQCNVESAARYIGASPSTMRGWHLYQTEPPSISSFGGGPVILQVPDQTYQLCSSV